MIYFIRLGSGAIKIGFTENLDVRIKALCAHYGCKLIVLKTMDGDKKKERELHKQFSHLRYDGREQFRPAPDLMEYIGQDSEIADSTKIDAHPMKKGIVIRRQYAATPDHLAELADLAGWWGGLKPAPDSAIIREAVHRAWETEAKQQPQAITTNRRNRREQQR